MSGDRRRAQGEICKDKGSTRRSARFHATEDGQGGNRRNIEGRSQRQRRHKRRDKHRGRCRQRSFIGGQNHNAVAIRRTGRHSDSLALRLAALRVLASTGDTTASPGCHAAGAALAVPRSCLYRGEKSGHQNQDRQYSDERSAYHNTIIPFCADGFRLLCNHAPPHHSCGRRGPSLSHHARGQYRLHRR